MTNPLALQVGEQAITQASTWRTYVVTLPGGGTPVLISSSMPGRFQWWIGQQNATGTASVYISEIATCTPDKGSWVVPLGTYHRQIFPFGDGVAVYGIAMNSPCLISVVEFAREPTQ